MLLPATAIPVCVLEEEYSSLWDSACEKDCPLMCGPYRVAVSADGWMKRESLLCSRDFLQPLIRGWGTVLVPDLPEALAHEVPMRKNIGLEESSHLCSLQGTTESSHL